MRFQGRHWDAGFKPRKSPFSPDGELVEAGVVAEQGQVFVNGLGSEQAVEWVFMVAGQTAGAQGVFHRDGKQGIGRAGHVCHEVFGEFGSKWQFA